MARVFLADCQPLFNEALEALITRDGTNEVVGQASAVPQIVASVPQLKPDLFVIDAGLALGIRPTLIETVLSELPDSKVILLAQDTDIDLLLHAIRSGAVGVVGKKSGTQTVLRAVQAVLDGEGVVPRAMLPQLFRRLLDMGDRATDAPLNRLSPREREVLALLGRGWSNAQIGRELSISPHTVRTHVQNILQKLEMHSKLEAASIAMEHGWPPGAGDPEERVMEQLEGRQAMAALQQLSPDQREVLLRMAGGLTAPEVAALLGKTTGAVKALQHRGLASLARVLGLRSQEQPRERPYPSSDPGRLTSQEDEEQ
jgi:DNA-binding NarL/FixJ family response regulator